MGHVSEILEKRIKNMKRLEKEAGSLFKGFDELMKKYYKPGALDSR